MVTPFSNSSSNVSNKTQIETVYCAFKQPDGVSSASLVEKRVFQLKSEGTSHSLPEVAPLKLVSNKNSIYFRFHTKGYTNLWSTIIKFPPEIMNFGRGFNVNSGVFVAHKPGIYKFVFKGTLEVGNFFAKQQQNYRFFISLQLNNGIDVVRANYAIENASLINLAIEETLKLNRGDEIYLTPGSYSKGLRLILENLYTQEETTSFSGFLIQEFDD